MTAAARENDRAHDELVEQLTKVPFFDGLTHEALRMIAGLATEETHATGTRNCSPAVTSERSAAGSLL